MCIIDIPDEKNIYIALLASRPYWIFILHEK